MVRLIGIFADLEAGPSPTTDSWDSPLAEPTLTSNTVHDLYRRDRVPMPGTGKNYWQRRRQPARCRLHCIFEPSLCTAGREWGY